MNILIVICRLLKIPESNLITLKVKTIKYNLIQDQRAILSLQLTLICDVLNKLCINKLNISCLKQIAHKLPLNKRVNATIFNIHVSEPGLLVNSFQKLFGKAGSMETSLLKLTLIKCGMFISFEKLQKVTNTCIHV